MSIYNIAKELFDGHVDELNELRDKFNKIKVIDQRTVDKFNAQFQKKMGFDFFSIG